MFNLLLPAPAPQAHSFEERPKKPCSQSSSGFRLILSTSSEQDLVLWAGTKPNTIGVINGKSVNFLKVRGGIERYYYTCSSGNAAATASSEGTSSSSPPPQRPTTECCRYLACVETEEVAEHSRREGAGDDDCIIVGSSQPRSLVYKVFECGRHTCRDGGSARL